MSAIRVRTGSGWQDVAVTGPTGPAGVGYTFKGTWSAATNYVVNDVVTLNGRTFVAVAPSLNVIPQPSGITQWTMMAAGFRWRGAYASGTTYYVLDTVSYNGSSYVAITTVTGGGNPDVNASWQAMALGLGAPTWVGVVMAANTRSYGGVANAANNDSVMSTIDPAGFVTLKGVAERTTSTFGWAWPMFTLAAGHRPNRALLGIPAESLDSALNTSTFRLSISSAGVVQAEGGVGTLNGAVGTRVFLDGIRFPTS